MRRVLMLLLIVVMAVGVALPVMAGGQEESAEGAERILSNLDNYPEEKIDKVKTCIMECSFSKNLDPSSLESAILQDADGLEATGAISIMRTYSSTGQMERPFYNPEDPFVKIESLMQRNSLWICSMRDY